MQTGKPPHLNHFDYAGFHRYSLTFCTDQRRPTFTERRAVDLVLSQIVRASTECAFDVPAYCFMPDHTHLLVHAVAKYIVDNPIRAKLVTSVKDYPYVGSLVCGLDDLLASLPPKSG